MDNCWITLQHPEHGTCVTHRPGCAVLKALREVGWQVARIYRGRHVPDSTYDTDPQHAAFRSWNSHLSCHGNCQDDQSRGEAA